MIIYKKLLELELELLAEIIDVLYFGKTMIIALDRHNSVISLLLLTFSLLSLDDSNDAAT
jgi:hypothetical protein